MLDQRLSQPAMDIPDQNLAQPFKGDLGPVRPDPNSANQESCWTFKKGP